MSEGPFGVVMVSAGFHPYVGGAEKQALELSAALQERGLKVIVATRRLPGLAAREQVRGVLVERLWRAGGGLVDATTFMASLLWFLWSRATDYQAVHVHLAGSPALPAALAGRVLGKPVVVKLGGGKGIGELAASSRGPAGRLKLACLSRLKPRFVAVAAELVEEARTYLGDVKVTIVPNGVDARRYRPAEPERSASLRAELGWPEGLGFLYVGRLSPEKRLPAFIEAWAARAKGGPNPSFCAFVGEGVEEAAMRQAARRAGVEDKVFFHGVMDGVERAYAAADVFVLPSSSEGLSNSLLEAMACGLAPLASRVGGTAEAVEDGRTGLLFAVDDWGQLDERLARLLAEPRLARSLGAAARQTVLERFSLDEVARRYEALYRGACA